MSDKIIRDELLRSHRYVTLSSDTARVLFVHLVLSSDHYSNCEIDSTALSIAMGREIKAEVAAPLLSELADKDLIRLYQVNGKSYAHIPRSRQRLRYLHGKHPRPPANIEDNEINVLYDKVRLKSDCSQTQVGEREVKRSEEKKTLSAKNRAQSQNPGIPVDWWADDAKTTAAGKTLGLHARPGESWPDFRARIRAAIAPSSSTTSRVV